MPPSTALISPEGLHDLAVAESALEGDREAITFVMAALKSTELSAALLARGASITEAGDIVADLTGDCFGGERSKGGLHRLLGRYNGSCPLPAFLRHVAINRLISLKRKQRPTISTDTDDARELPFSQGPLEGSRDEALIALLRDAFVKALARMDPEKLVLIRLIDSYQIPQKQIGALLGWHESKISRARSQFLSDLRIALMEEVHRADPWLQLEWEDFLALCGESADLFG